MFGRRDNKSRKLFAYISFKLTSIFIKFTGHVGLLSHYVCYKFEQNRTKRTLFLRTIVLKIYLCNLHPPVLLAINPSFLLRFTNPSKRSTFNSVWMPDKNFRSIALKVCSVGVTTNCRKIRANFAYNSFKLASILIKFTGHVGLLSLHMCSKFEENRSTRRLCLHDLKIFFLWCEGEEEEEEEEEYEENQTIFKIEYLANCWRDFFQIWYGRWCICRAYNICKFRRNRLNSFRDTGGWNRRYFGSRK